MDHSVTRRGKPCWYKVADVGEIAINDAIFLEAVIYELIRTYFRSEPYYADLLDLFHSVSFKTSLGQLVDLLTSRDGAADLELFSKEAYAHCFLPCLASSSSVIDIIGWLFTKLLTTRFTCLFFWQ